MNLRYVFSAPSMMRLNPDIKLYNQRNYHDNFVDLLKLSIDKIRILMKNVINENSVLDSVEFDILYNAYTEKDFGKYFFNNDRLGFDKIYADSGGLQMVTKGGIVTDKLKTSVYDIQSNYSDYAMCFDIIPCKNKPNIISSNNRADANSKIFYPDELTNSSIATAENIRTQINYFKNNNSQSKIFHIIQGNSYNDMIDWFDIGNNILQNDNSYIQGLALSDTCIGNKEFETIEMLVAYHFLSEKYSEDVIKNHIHLLGVGAQSRLLPLIYLIKSGFISKDKTISIDSSTHSMISMMGKYKDNSISINNISDTHILIKKIFNFFKPEIKQVYENYDEQLILDNYLNNIESSSKILVNLKLDSPEYIISKTLWFQVCLYHVYEFLNQLNQTKNSNRHLYHLTQVKNMDDYFYYIKNYGNYLKSNRIERYNPNKKTLTQLFKK